MTATAIDTIKEQIRQKRAALDQLHDDVEALEKTLVILEKEQHLAIKQRLEGLQPMWEKAKKSSRKGVIQKDSIPYFAQKFLREAGKPQTGDELVARYLTTGRRVTKASLMGALYRLIKRHQVFKIVKPGTFGLLEWSEGK